MSHININSPLGFEAKPKDNSQIGDPELFKELLESFSTEDTPGAALKKLDTKTEVSPIAERDNRPPMIMSNRSIPDKEMHSLYKSVLQTMEQIAKAA
jgi:hypothetical protein